MSNRTITQIVPALKASDGAGVNLKRSLGGHRHIRVDPFLMLDEFSSTDPSDYIAGFPPHPHRGFETITYMLEGNMRHEDHLGNQGHISSGGAQWMTAGRGIIHSEMPEQTEGKLHGFQLWLNLPSHEKMKAASYRDIAANEIPSLNIGNSTIRVLAGSLTDAQTTITGPIGNIAPLTTDPYFYDVISTASHHTTLTIPNSHNAFVYVYEGMISISNTQVHAQELAILSEGSVVEISTHETPARFLLLAGKPINEPIVQYGPFVMNTKEEVEQAMQDYREGRLTEY